MQPRNVFEVDNYMLSNFVFIAIDFRFTMNGIWSSTVLKIRGQFLMNAANILRGKAQKNTTTPLWNHLHIYLAF